MYCDRILSIFPNVTLKLANYSKLKDGAYAAKLMELCHTETICIFNHDHGSVWNINAYLNNGSCYQQLDFILLEFFHNGSFFLSRKLSV